MALIALENWQPMKIAIWHNLPSGGGKRALHMHARGLHERGHKLITYTTNHSDRTYLPLTEYTTETVLPLKDAAMQTKWFTSLLRKYSSAQAVQRLDMLRRMMEHTQQCMQEIAQQDCDVLLANSCRFTYCSSIGIHAKIPSVHYLGEPYRPFYEALPRLAWLLPDRPSKHPRNPIKRGLESIEEAHSNYAIRVQAGEELRWARSYNRILVNSLYSRESVLRAYNCEAKVCYLGIDSEMFFASYSIKQPYVIGLGGMHYGKQVQSAIEAIGSMPKRIRPPLQWYGNIADATYLSQMNALAHRLAVDFSHRTRVPDSELQKSMSKAACFIYTPYLEPFGLAPLEANACGTAVVAIAEGGIRETIVDGINGFLAMDNNPDELARLISGFTQNLDYATKFGLQAREHVIKQWPVNSAIDRLEQHLQEVANR